MHGFDPSHGSAGTSVNCIFNQLCCTLSTLFLISGPLFTLAFARVVLNVCFPYLKVLSLKYLPSPVFMIAVLLMQWRMSEHNKILSHYLS